MSSIKFDIETGPLPLETIQSILPPFDMSSIGSHPGEFDESAVKTGNTKDPEKIKDKIEGEREKHNKAVADYYRKQDTAESTHWQKVLDKAALSATTGQVVAIGYRGEKQLLHLAINGVDERALLKQFWKTFRASRASSRPLVGFNIFGFDIPFLAQRSWMLGMEVPAELLTPAGYPDSIFIDLMRRWGCGDRQSTCTLDIACRACGVGGKPNGCKGADFARLLFSDDPSDVQTAISYLENDLDMTTRFAERLGVL